MTRKIWPWRRAFQAVVLASIVLFPFIARYGHYIWARQMEKFEASWAGSPAGISLRGVEALLSAGLPREEAGVPGRRPRKELLRRTAWFVGTPAWSARLFGYSMTDLLAGAESILASRSVRSVLALSLVLPLLGTLLLGRVYCGWICPMGLILPLARRARSLLAFLELPPAELRFWKGNKYAIFAVAGAAALIAGSPILHHLYPPAILGREAHSFVTVLFDRAEGGRLSFPWGSFSAGMLFLGVVALIEVAAAPGFWCASLCPGGALYSALSRWRVLRLRRDSKACVDCVLCDRACPMQLEPMRDNTGPECDACGVCVDLCPTRALSFGLPPKPAAPAAGGGAKTAGGVLTLLLAGALPAAGHHIIGIPHYAYDNSFPQAPVLKLKDKIGPFEVTLTGYPGNPRPGEKTELHVYVTDPATNMPYDKPVLLEARRLYPMGLSEKIQEPQESLKDMALHKFHVVYPAEANYEVVLILPGLDGTSTLRFPLVVGEPGSPWRDVGLFGGGMLGLLVVVRAIRIKRARAAGGKAR